MPKLPDAADRVLDLDVDLRTVKRGLAFDPLVRDAALIQSTRKLLFGGFPLFVRAEITFVLSVAADRQLKFYLVETVGLEDLDREIETIRDLGVNLIGPYKKMSIVDGKSANAHQAVQRAGKFGTINRAHLRISLRQIAIRMSATTCKCRYGTGSSSA